jgi:hypothetical protein
VNEARVENGKIVEEWEIADQLALMRQLGLIEAPVQAGGARRT